VPCDDKDMQLFRACTKITIGDGQSANFWNDRWLSGPAPTEMAPLVYRLARGKSLCVVKAILMGDGYVAYPRFQMKSSYINSFIYGLK
jgi:hypothetical protein